MKELRISVPHLGKSEHYLNSLPKEFRKIGHTRYLLISGDDPYDVISTIICLIRPYDFSVYNYPSFINLYIVND